MNSFQTLIKSLKEGARCVVAFLDEIGMGPKLMEQFIVRLEDIQVKLTAYENLLLSLGSENIDKVPQEVS